MTRVLQTREVRDRHTSANINNDFQTIVEERDLLKKVAGITSDIAHNIVAALELLPLSHMPCFAHTFKMTVNEGLKVPLVEVLLARFRKVVCYFNPSYGFSIIPVCGRGAKEICRNILIDFIV